MCNTMGKFAAILAVASALTVATSSAPAATKNVIVMIADGAGFNTWYATAMYQGRWDASRGRSKQVFDGPGWVGYGCSTYPLTTAKKPSGKAVQDPTLIYDPAKAWGSTNAYAWLTKTYTDSAAAATALSTGVKTYNNAINWSDRDEGIFPTLSERCKAAGKAAGVITTVQWSHATPAGFSNAHEPERDNYESIARQMFSGSVLNVIMGAGNPDFDNNGRPAVKQQDYKYVGGDTAWKDIEKARRTSEETFKGFRPVSTKQEFEALTTGTTPPRVLGTVQVKTTLRQAREGKDTGDPKKETPINSDLPDLPLMVRAAINVLDDTKAGFFLMIEGGAVDWANHSNQPARMIQEHMDFIAAVETVVNWVEAKSKWDETLLILTADHETGLIWGPQSDVKGFDPIVDHGKGVMPGFRYNTKTHSNSLVPLYARGAGSERFASKVVAKDPVRGPYVDNTSVTAVISEAIGK